MVFGVASRGMPVAEAIHDGVDGVLVPMDDHRRLINVFFHCCRMPITRSTRQFRRQSALAWDHQLRCQSLHHWLSPNYS